MDPGAGLYALEKRKIFCRGRRASFTRSTPLSWLSVTHFHISPLLVACPILLIILDLVRLNIVLSIQREHSNLPNFFHSSFTFFSREFQVVSAAPLSVTHELQEVQYYM